MAADNPEFVISRLFDAPRTLLWQSWTAPDLMAKWWGPKGMTVGKYKMDLRPGGSYLYSMLMPDGEAMWGKFEYREITAPQKLLFVNYFSDEQGGVTRHPLNPSWPLKSLTQIAFEEEKSQARVTVRWTPIDPSEEEQKTFLAGRDSMRQGWGGTFDQLAEFLKGYRQKAAS